MYKITRVALLFNANSHSKLFLSFYLGSLVVFHKPLEGQFPTFIFQLHLTQLESYRHNYIKFNYLFQDWQYHYQPFCKITLAIQMIASLLSVRK